MVFVLGRSKSNKKRGLAANAEVCIMRALDNKFMRQSNNILNLTDKNMFFQDMDNILMGENNILQR